tara:strand:+ start:235 stop:339 length:105 start_codon:yes stop_codon:yes gene_type:complete
MDFLASTAAEVEEEVVPVVLLTPIATLDAPVVKD